MEQYLKLPFQLQLKIDNASPENEQVIVELSRCFMLFLFCLLLFRYGSPGNVTKEYTEFSEWYLKTFSCKLFLPMYIV